MTITISLPEMIHTAVKEYAGAEKQVARKVIPTSRPDDDTFNRCLLAMGHAHIEMSLAMMKESGLTPQQIAEEFYRVADEQATS